MSEHLRPSEPLKQVQAESFITPKHLETQGYALGDKPDMAKVAELKEKALAHAVATSEHEATHTSPPSSHSFSIGLHAKLKADSYERTIKRIQGDLPPIQRAMSRFVHAAPIDKTSEFASATIGRPYGILGGSLLALTGSAYLIYAAHRAGYAYNYSWIIVLFGAGYALGTVLELMTKIRKK